MPAKRTRQSAEAGFEETSDLLRVARALDDLRRGVPVLVKKGRVSSLVGAVETLGEERYRAYFVESGGGTRILLSANRAATLKMAAGGADTVSLKLEPGQTMADLRALADPTDDLARPLSGPFRRADHKEGELDRAALRLCKLARLLPCALIAEIGDPREGPFPLANFIEADIGAVNAFPEGEASSMREVARATIPLEAAENSRVVIFRPLLGGPEHLALLIGEVDPRKPVLTRIHSACLTGDLLGSLRCDCGEQLRGALGAIGKAGGGVLLYLAQEGRGIGLGAKIKAYALQDQGFDTLEANLRLGFETDERVFAPAAEILKQLGVSKVRLLTNNPEKVKALEVLGISVVERVPHAFEPNPHNAGYLRTKRDKAGHKF